MNKYYSFVKQPQNGWQYLLLLYLMGVLVSCGSNELNQAPFDFQVRVREEGTGNAVVGANVTIEGSGVPKDEITDSTGFVRIRIDAASVNEPGKIIVTANGYETYSQNIDLTESVLPEIIQLKPQIPAAAVPSQSETAISETIIPPLPSVTASIEISSPFPLVTDSFITVANAPDMTLLQTLGEGRILNIALSPNPEDKLLAIATPLGVYLYDTETRQQVKFLATERSVTQIAFSPDSTRLAIGISEVDNDAMITLWQVDNGEKIAEFGPYDDNSQSLAFSPNGLRLIDGAWETLRLWRVDDGELLDEEIVESEWVNSTVFSSSSDMLASAQSDGVVNIWHVIDDSLELHRTFVHSPTVDLQNVSFSPDDEFIASAGWDNNTITLWRVSGETTPAQTLEHEGKVQNLLFYPYNQWLVSGATDDDLYLWNYVTGELVDKRDNVHIGDLDGLSMLVASEPLIASSSMTDNDVKLWHIQNDEFVLQPPPVEGKLFPPINSLAFAPDANTLVAGAYYTMWQWHLVDGNWEGVEPLQPGRSRVAISPNGKWLAAGNFGDVDLWKNNNGLWEKLETPLSAHDNWLNQLVFSMDSQILASASDDGTAHLWILQDEEWKEHHTLEHDGSKVRGIAFSPDGETLVSSAEDGKIRIWSVAAGEAREIHIGADEALWSVAYSPDGSLLAFGTESGVIHVWQMDNGGRVATLDPLTGHSWRIRSLVFSSDSHLLISGSGDKTVRVWATDDSGKWQTIKTFSDSREAVLSVLFSYDDSLLATTSYDGIVRLYGLGEP